MLKKTLIATAAIGATLLAAATLLPALAQSRGAPIAPSATSAAPAAQAPADATAQNQRATADYSGSRKAGQEQDRRKAKGSDDDEHRGDDNRGGSTGKDKGKSRD